MGERSPFTLELSLRNNQGFQRPLVVAVDIAHALRISARTVGELKAFGPGIFGPRGGELVIDLMKQRHYRRDLFVSECRRLGGHLADCMEDAEGWHDASRIEKARVYLGAPSPHDWSEY